MFMPMISFILIFPSSFSTKDLKLLRVSMGSFMELLTLVIETMNEFDIVTL